jgi:hypothetical protein
VINNDDFDKVLPYIAKADMVYIDSIGGSVKSAILIGIQVRLNGINTVVGKECYSACSIIFAGGIKRMANIDSIIGMHSPAYVNEDDMPFEKSLTSAYNAGVIHAATIGLYYIEMGVTPNVSLGHLLTPNSKMLIKTNIEWLDDNLITDILPK